MTKAQPKTQTRTRKSGKLREPEHQAQLELIHDYARGRLSVAEIALKYGTTEKAVNLCVTRHWKELTNMRESRALIAGLPVSSSSLKAIQNTNLINAEFLAQLTPDKSQGLSEPESIYAWMYVHTGDSILAIEEAGLNTGLMKGDKKSRNSYDKALYIRSLYLNSKPNVADYIKDLRERKFSDSDITKASVMLELKEQLEQLKQQPQKNRREILRVIELMGKCVGAFIDRVEVGKVDHNKAFDQMLLNMEQAKVAEFEVLETREIAK